MKNKTLGQIVIALIFAAIAGFLTGDKKTLFGVPYLHYYELIGDLFVNALTLVVVPLVASSLIIGTSRLGAEERVGILGGWTFFLFVTTACLAVVVGLSMALLFQPGIHVNNFDPVTMETITFDRGAFGQVKDLLFRLIPSNILAVASQGQMLGLILFSFVFGFYSSRIDQGPKEVVQGFFRGVFQIMMKATHLVMRALPFGVFGLMAKVIATTGVDAFKSVALFAALVLLGFILYFFVLLPLLLLLFGVSPKKHLKAITPALITAFSTSSTAATLPITLECMEKKAGIPNRICSFILPLGTSINLAGTALYCTLAVIFIAQYSGVYLSFFQLFIVFFMGLFTSLGMVAGIPSASLVTIVVILQTIGLPVEALAIILPVERILDMCRTTVNVFTNSCCCAIVYRCS